jgi:GxxExxY protein
MEVNQITSAIIGGAIEVHRVLGPGLLESAYEECLCREWNNEVLCAFGVSAVINKILGGQFVL